MRQRRSLFNDKRVDPSERYNSYKYLCAYIYEAKIKRTKKEKKRNSSILIVGDFNIPLFTMDRSP